MIEARMIEETPEETDLETEINIEIGTAERNQGAHLEVNLSTTGGGTAENTTGTIDGNTPTVIDISRPQTTSMTTTVTGTTAS